MKNPNLVRCRLVAQEFAGSEKREDFYAGTPPMAATRYLLSDSVSRGRGAYKQKRKLKVLDVKRAALHGIATRTFYVELPGEESENGKYVGRLNRTLYGTRDAPVAWLRAVREDMEALGFLECKVTTGVFVHPARDIREVSHVDDFLVAGGYEDLTWLRDEMSQKYELKVQIAGWEPGDDKELSFLGRTSRLGPDGVTMEGDDKHVQILLEEWDMQACSAVSTPYVKPTQAFVASASRDLPPKEASLFRRAAARVNYIALGRRTSVLHLGLQHPK